MDKPKRERLRPCSQGHDRLENLATRDYLKNMYLHECREVGACPVCAMVGALFAAGIAARLGLEMSEEVFLRECRECYQSVLQQAAKKEVLA